MVEIWKFIPILWALFQSVCTSYILDSSLNLYVLIQYILVMVCYSLNYKFHWVIFALSNRSNWGWSRPSSQDITLLFLEFQIADKVQKTSNSEGSIFIVPWQMLHTVNLIVCLTSQELNWSALEQKRISPPFIPSSPNEVCVKKNLWRAHYSFQFTWHQILKII
jgi:hypothetical protein